MWTLGRGPAVGRLPPSSAHLGSVVGLLLLDSNLQAQMWGLELLLELLKSQVSAEYITQLEAFVPVLCAKATAFLSRSPSAPKDADEEHGASAVAATSLRLLLEHLRLCLRISYVSRHLDSITYAVLGIIEAEGTSTGVKYDTIRDAVASGEPPAAPALVSKPSIGARVGASSPGLAAILVYQELGHMTRDAAEGKKVLDFLLRFLDERPQRWEGGPALDLGLGSMRDACSAEHQRYLLASALLCHVGTLSPLSSRQRAIVLAEAMKDADALDQGMVAPALLMALQELPPALASAANGAPGWGTPSWQEDLTQLENAALEATETLARRIGGRPQLTAVLAAAMGRLGPPSPRASATLRCCAAAAAAYATLDSHAPGSPVTSHLSNVLLKSTLNVCLQWGHEQRVLAHTVLQRALVGTPKGAYHQQVELVLSSLWHEAALLDNTPACYVAMCGTFDGLLGAAAEPQALLRACQFVLALQADAATPQGGYRLGSASPAQRAAVLALCAAMWTRLAERLACPDLLRLQPSGLAHLPSLKFSSKGLEIGGANAAETDFTPVDEGRAAAAQVELPADAQQVLGGVSDFKRLHGGELEKAFVALPVASIQPSITLSAPGKEEEGQRHSAQALRLLAAFAAEGKGGKAGGDGPGVVAVAAEKPAVAGGVEEAEVQQKGETKSLEDVLARVEAAVRVSAR